MKAKDQFIEWLREKITQNPAQPPASAWQEIADGLDLEESWAEIDESLDLDHVWQKLDGRLDKYNKLLRFEKISYLISAVAILLLLVNFFVPKPIGFTDQGNPLIEVEKIQFISSTEKSKDSLIPNDVEEVVSANTSYKNTSSVKEKSNSKKEQAQYIFDQKHEPIAREEKEASEDEKGVLQDEKAKLAVAAKNEQAAPGTQKAAIREGVLLPDKNSLQKQALFGQPMPAGFQLIESKTEIDLQAKTPGIPGLKEQEAGGVEVYPSSYLGFGAAFKVSALLNNKTMHAMERSSLLSSTPTWQQDFYLLYGRKIADRFFLQTDFYLQNKVGQQYNEYREGNYGSFREELNYQSAGISLSWLQKQIGYGKFPVYVRLSGGVYAGRLLAAEENTVSGSTSRTAEYTRFHGGLLAGYEYDVLLHQQLMLSYGIRGRIDAMNIYAGTVDIPSSFRKTKAASLDFTLALKYLINK